MRSLRLIVVCLAGALAVVPFAVTATTVGDDAALQSAIADYVAGRGDEYAGACADAELPDDVGLWCSEITSITDDQAVVNLGPTFSEFVETGVVFTRTNGEWIAREDAAAPELPVAGVGANGTSGGSVAALTIALAGGAIIASGLFLRRRGAE